ncbi:MAG: APC family permease [Clostridiales Family XIII bacterium]|jgi:amino acid transporter|nr:APC family permease [Clostridiales Family XIII bacterium]
MSQEQKVTSRVGVKDIVTSKIGVLSVVGMFYALCCAGAYGIEEMIPEVGPGLTLVMLIVLPFVWALPYSYICAELGSARPDEGGIMVWVKEALGEFWFGIMVFVNFIWGLVANTVYVVLAVSYLEKIIPGGFSGTVSMILKITIVLIFFIINIIGIKEVSITSTILSILVVVAFAIVAVVGFAHWNFNPIEPFMSDAYDGDLFRTIGAGLAIGMWMYSGFDQISTMAGEIKDSHRVIPKALMIVIPLMIITYVIPTAAGLASIGDWAEWTTEIDGVGYAEVLFEYGGTALGIFFICVAIIGQCSIFNMCVATAARSSLILSDEHFGPKVLAKLRRKKGSPYVSLTVVAIVTAALLPFDFKFLVVIDVFFCVLVCALTVISAAILKRRIPASEIPFKVPGGRVGHTICVALVLIFCVALLLLNGSDYFFGGLLVIFVIPILYILAKWAFKGLSKNDPKLYPIDSRTGLAFGDLTKIGGLYFALGIFAIIARYFLSWYEGSGWFGYDAEEAWWIWPDDYDMPLFGTFPGELQAITVTGIVAVVIGVVLFIIGKRLSKNDADLLPQGKTQAH